MKNVLLLVHDDVGQEARLQVALDLTRALGGHLHCLDVTLMPKVIDSPYDGVGVALLLEDELNRESKNRTRIEERLTHEDVPFSWTDATGDFELCIKEAAALADLIVVNRKLTSFAYPDMRRVASDLIVHAHRPIVAVPEDAKGFGAFGKAVVAWDGSSSSSAAMIAAVPLLKLAETVTILQIEDGSVETPAEEGAAYLARYDIRARVVRDDPMGQSIGQMLLTAVTAQAASYVVMGGYGHHRTMEAVFGGATRTMLSESPVSVFLAH